MQQKKLFDHPVGADQEGLGDGQPERLRGSKVDDEIELIPTRRLGDSRGIPESTVA